MTLQISIAPQLTPAAQPPVRPPLWMHLEDKAVQGYIRSCAPCPAVWVLKDDPHVVFGEQWQYYLVAINPGMTLENVMLLLDYRLAFANRLGLTNPNDPRNDYITRAVLGRKDPQLDKVRTCSRNVLTGTVVYSLAIALQKTIAAAAQTLTRRQSFLQLRRSFRTLLTGTNALEPTLFDSRKPPPLKPGKTYPTRVQDVDPDDYVYLPRTHPWMFLTANIVNRSGEVVQFPRGAVYAWTEDNTPRSFLPHIYNPDFGPVRYDVSRLWRVPDSQPIPRPYRSN